MSLMNPMLKYGGALLSQTVQLARPDSIRNTAIPTLLNPETNPTQKQTLSELTLSTKSIPLLLEDSIWTLLLCSQVTRVNSLDGSLLLIIKKDCVVITYSGELRASFVLTYLSNEYKIRYNAHKIGFYTISQPNPSNFKVISYLCLVVQY